MCPVHIGIMLGCHNQDLTLHFRCPGVWRILGIHGKAHPVDRSSRFHHLRKFCSDPQCKGPAHAIPGNADPAGIRNSIGVCMGQHRSSILSNQTIVKIRHQIEHLLGTGGGFPMHRKRADIAIVEIGKHDVVARCTDPPGHVVQFFTLSRRID